MLDERIYNETGKTEVIYSEDFGGGYRGVVISIRGSHPCAYIQVPDPTVIGYDESDEYAAESIDLDVHGGVTFVGTLEKYNLDGLWIGWDYAHWGDYIHTGVLLFSGNEKQWTLEEIVKEVKDVINGLR